MIQLTRSEKDTIGQVYEHRHGGVLSDAMIKQLITIEPLAEDSPKGQISSGLTGYGYDMRVDRKYKVFTNIHGGIVDPKNFDARCFMDFEGDECIIPPNSFALAVSVETFHIPRGILAICVGKSTYARCGIVVNVTPLEPEWRGKVTLEISNTTPCPCKIYSGEGIAQVIFLRGMMDCTVSYADKKGKYQDQKDLTLPIVTKPFMPSLVTPERLTITPLHVCKKCSVRFRVTVYQDDYVEWKTSGSNPKLLFPYLSDDEQNLLITGLCTDCLYNR